MADPHWTRLHPGTLAVHRLATYARHRTGCRSRRAAQRLTGPQRLGLPGARPPAARSPAPRKPGRRSPAAHSATPTRPAVGSSLTRVKAEFRSASISAAVQAGELAVGTDAHALFCNAAIAGFIGLRRYQEPR
jgi:hypothetical protein